MKDTLYAKIPPNSSYSNMYDDSHCTWIQITKYSTGALDLASVGLGENRCSGGMWTETKVQWAWQVLASVICSIASWLLPRSTAWDPQSLLYLFFNWRIIALQCVSFCCAAKCLSHMYTQAPPLLHLHLPLFHSPRSSQD